METVEEYIQQFDGEKQEWLRTFVDFMRQSFPQAREIISYQIPTYRFGKMYIAFSVAKEHFTFHSLDFEMIDALHAQLPRAKFGKGSAKVKFADREAIPVLMEMARRIVARNEAG